MLGALLVGSVLGGASLLRGNARRRSRQGIRAIDLVGDSRMRGPTSTQGMRFSADARRLRCPGGHAGDFARCLAPLPPSGFRARILLDAGVFFVARTGPPGRAVHFWEFSASRGGCIRAGIVFLSQRDPSAGDLGWLTASGAAITRVSRRAVPQNDANRAASTIRGTACGGRDAENSGFCTVQAGVRWDEKGCPVFLCMTQAKLCKTIGRHAPDTQPGRAIRRRLGPRYLGHHHALNTNPATKSSVFSPSPWDRVWYSICRV